MVYPSLVIAEHHHEYKADLKNSFPTISKESKSCLICTFEFSIFSCDFKIDDFSGSEFINGDFLAIYNFAYKTSESAPTLLRGPPLYAI